MALPPDQIPDVAKAIQLALTPVFLLTGVASILSVMAGRMSRIIDRARALTEGPQKAELSEVQHFELRNLEHRRHCVSIAITACTIAALLLCTTIIMLFIDAMFNAPIQWLVGGLFIGATLALVVGWAYFLREVHLAFSLTRIQIPKAK